MMMMMVVSSEQNGPIDEQRRGRVFVSRRRRWSAAGGVVIELWPPAPGLIHFRPGSGGAQGRGAQRGSQSIRLIDVGAHAARGGQPGICQVPMRGKFPVMSCESLSLPISRSLSRCRPSDWPKAWNSSEGPAEEWN